MFIYSAGPCTVYIYIQYMAALNPKPQGSFPGLSCGNLRPPRWAGWPLINSTQVAVSCLNEVKCLFIHKAHSYPSLIHTRCLFIYHACCHHTTFIMFLTVVCMCVCVYVYISIIARNV